MLFDRVLRLRLSLAFVVSIILAVTFVLHAPRFLSDGPSDNEFHPIVAIAEDLSGNVSIARPTDGQSGTNAVSMPFKLDEPIRHLDRLLLFEGAKLLVTIEGPSANPESSPYKIELIGPAEVVFEKWNWQLKQTPLLIYIDPGEYQVVNQGAKGDVYIIDQNQMFAPENKKDRPEQSLTIDPRIAAVHNSNVEVIEKQIPTTELPEKIAPEEKDSSFIASTLASQRDEFIKCQSNAIRDNQKARGEVLVGFIIQKTGKTDEIRVLRSTVGNPSLEACVVSVVQRTAFFDSTNPQRSASQIRTSFPLVFQ